jgi:hypothetical protein
MECARRDPAVLRATFEINTFGGDGWLNVSRGRGQLSAMDDGGAPAYQSSKAAAEPLA